MAVKLAPVIVAVGMSEPVMVTCAVAVAVDAPGAYCTIIVQLPPAATTVAAVQVPPVIVNVPPAVPTLAIVGAAVMVRGSFAVAALVTVIVPVSVVVLGGVVASAGAGAEMVTAVPCTVNGMVLVAPIAVVRPMLRIPNVAVAEIARLAVTVVELTTVMADAVTPAPSPVIAVVPVRLAPVKVTGSAAVPRSPAFGLIDVSVAPSTVNGTVLLAPPGVVTVTVLAVSAAVVEMVKVAFKVSALPKVTPLTVTPAPDTATADAPDMKLVPVRVTGIVAPRTPIGGATEVRVGAGGMTTLKGTELLTPPGAVTVTFLAVPAAVAAMVNVALTWVALEVIPLTVTPPPGTVIAVVPVSPLPIRTTGIVWPRVAETGEMDVSTGPVTL